jgi:hypothetical protein
MVAAMWSISNILDAPPAWIRKDENNRLIAAGNKTKDSARASLLVLNCLFRFRKIDIVPIAIQSATNESNNSVKKGM